MHSITSAVDSTCSASWHLRTLHDLPSRIVAEFGTTQPGAHSPDAFAVYRWKPIVLLTLSLMVTVTIFGNALICVAAMHNHHLRHPSNVFFISLAVTNLFYACTVMTFQIAYNSFSVNWFTDHMCVAFISLDMLFCTSSILHLAAIALDRFVHVHASVTYSRKFNTKIHVLVILIMWIFSALLAFIPLKFDCYRASLHVVATDNHTGHWSAVQKAHFCNHHVNLTCSLVNALLSFVLPLLFMIIVYGRLFQITRQHLHQIRSQKPSIDLIVEGEVQSSDKMMIGATDTVPSADPSVNSQAVSSTSIRSKFFLDPLEDSPDMNRTTVATRHFSECCQPNSRISPRMSRSTNDTTLLYPTTGSLLFGNRMPRHRNSLNVPLRYPARPLIDSVRSSSLMSRPKESSMNTIMRIRVTMHNEHKAAVTLAVILGSFILCWMPFFFISCLAAVCNCIRRELYFAATWLGYFNACLNPVIYSLFNSKFRRACVKLLCAWRKCRGQHEQYGLAKLRYCGDATIQLALGRMFLMKGVQPSPVSLPNSLTVKQS